MVHCDLVWCQRIPGRAGLRTPCTGLAFGQCNLVLKLCNRAGQEPERLPVVAAQRGAQLCLPDDPAQLFWHHQPGMISPVSIDQVPNLACHTHDPL
jgi:hypothetical protein